MNEHLSVAQYQQYLKTGKLPSDSPPAAPKKSKMRNTKVTLDTFVFDSIIEGAYYLWLLERKKQGEVSHFFMQTAIHLPGPSKYLLDFLVFLSDGGVVYVDVKGKPQPMYKLKKKTAQALYPITVTEVFKEDIPSSYRVTAKAHVNIKSK